MNELLQVATAGTAVTAGLSGGVFFAFSTFVMPALDRLPPPQGIAAMQSIDRLAVTPPFMAALFLPAVAGAGLAAWAATHRDDAAAPWLAAGAGLYLAGAIGVTIAANVPRNDALARLDPHASGAAGRWRDYVRGWTRWNHVRTATALAAAGALTAAAVAG